MSRPIPKLVIACPKGHAAGNLQIRTIVDARPFLKDGVICPDLSARACPENVGGAHERLGFDYGIFCYECVDWFEETACVHPTDDKGNPVLKAAP